MKYYLINPRANNGRGIRIPEGKFINARKLDYRAFFASLREDDEAVLVGGDGTISWFINHVDLSKLKNNVYIYGNGSGNDLLHDIGEEPRKEVLLNPYLTNLPTVRVKGKEYKFINNMAFGIDGYCCQEADRLRAKKPNRKISYAAIALKGLLYDFKPCSALVEVDGKRYRFDNVWMAPTMKGRYYGGGMMAAPNQDRFSDQLTVVISTCKSRLRVLRTFPAFFKGEHVKQKDIVKIFTGRKIRVKFSRPCAAMFDGETVLDVTEYSAEL